MSTATEWVNDLSLSQEPSVEEIKSFFGVPPDPEEALEQNIARKRRTWSAKKRERKLSPNAERKVNGALQLIEALSQMVIGGVEEELDFSDLDAAATALTGFSTVIELWAYVDELLADGALDKAVNAVRDGVSRFGTDADAQAAFAYVMAQAVPQAPDEATAVQLAEEGLAASAHALTAEPSPESPWGIEDAGQWYAQFSLDLGRPNDALEALEGVQQRVGTLTPILRVMRGRAFAFLDRDEEARQEVVEAVRSVPKDDFRTRVAGWDVMLTLAQFKYLPIASADHMKQYQDTVEVAAWCAEGVPEAEALTRKHRLWARQASGGAYVGSLGRKALVSLLTGFTFAPLINRLESKRVWKVFFDGPGSCSEDTWFQAAGSGLAGYVNGAVLDRLPWFADVADQGYEAVEEIPATGMDPSAGARSTPLVILGIFVLIAIVLGIGNAFELAFYLVVIGVLMTIILSATSRLIPGGTPEVTLAGTSPEGAVTEVAAAVTSARDELIGFPSGIFFVSEFRDNPVVVIAKEYSGETALAPKFHHATGCNPIAFVVGLAGYLFYSLPVKLAYWLTRFIMTSRLEARLSPTTLHGEEACLANLKFAGPSGRIAGASFLDALSEPLLPERYCSAEELAEGKARSRGAETAKLFLWVNAGIYVVLLFLTLGVVLGN